MKIIILMLILTTTLIAGTSDFKSHFFVNGKAVTSHHVMIMPGKPLLVEVYFSNPKNGEIYTDFKLMHGKYMHMVVAKKDLSEFKHVHPYFDPTTGRFSLTLNLPYQDPDNQDVRSAIKTAGMFMVMTDVIVKGVGMRMDHIMLHAHGNTVAKVPELDAEVAGVITKFFKREEEVTPTYRAHFSHRQITGCSGNIVSFEVEMFKHNGVDYTEMLDFEPWLSEAAHSVWLSQNFMSSMDMNMPFAHMHSPFVLEDDGTSERVNDHVLRFNFHDQNKMKPGLQKMWIQFKDKNKIMKIPFIFNYKPAPVTGC
jgi:hypothetical protein